MKITKEDLQIYMPLAVIIGVGAYEVYNVMKNKNSTLADKPETYIKSQIPKGVSKSAIITRRKIINDFYQNLSYSYVYNKEIQQNIYITKISRRETYWHAAKSYKSTLAVFSLKEILENAKLIGKEQPKVSSNNQKNFKELLIFGYNLTGIGLVKLTVGKLKNQQKIQYCITAVETL